MTTREQRLWCAGIWIVVLGVMGSMGYGLGVTLGLLAIPLGFALSIILACVGKGLCDTITEKGRHDDEQ